MVKFPGDKLDNSCDERNLKIKVEVPESMKELFQTRCSENGYSMSRMLKFFIQMVNTKSFVMIDGHMVTVIPGFRKLSVHKIQELFRKELIRQNNEQKIAELTSVINSKSAKMKAKLEKKIENDIADNKDVIVDTVTGKPVGAKSEKVARSGRDGFRSKLNDD